MNSEYQYHSEDYFQGRFDNIVSVQGFGWSGSTAVCDLLSEFSGWTVLFGTFPSDNNLGCNFNNYETQLFHDLGFMELRNSCNIYDSDDLFDLRIKQLISKYYAVFLDDGTKFWLASPFYRTLKFKYCLACFLLRILDLTEDDKNFILENIASIFFPLSLCTGAKKGELDHYDPFSFKDFYEKSFKPSLSFIKEGYVFYRKSKKLRRFGVSEIDSAIREFLYNFFEITSSGNRNICFSQLFCCYYIDDENKPDFIPKEFKHIYVYRDPRDSYFSKLKRYNAFSSVDYYISYCRNINLWGNYYSGNNRLLLKFESLVNNYEYQINRIYKFLNLDKHDHIDKLKHFVPDVSIKSIGSYKRYHDQNIMERIRLANPQFYFDEPEYWNKRDWNK